jgi:hypothetical protein
VTRQTSGFPIAFVPSIETPVASIPTEAATEDMNTSRLKSVASRLGKLYGSV